MNDPTYIRLENVAKSFGKNEVLENINLEFGPGKIIGLLGPNSSGKSTLLRIMVGLYTMSGGTCEIFGTPSLKLDEKELARIGYVHQEGEMVDWMKVRQLIDYTASYYKNWDRDFEKQYIQDFNMDENARVGLLSPGERQKLAILLALGHDPDLIIMDEPAAGLDPIARERFLEILQEKVQGGGRTILISSHILQDIEKIVDHVIVLKNKSVALNNSLDETQEKFFRLKITSLNGDIPPLPQLPGIIKSTITGKQAELDIHVEDQEQLKRLCQEYHWEVEFLPLRLETIYRYIQEGKV